MMNEDDWKGMNVRVHLPRSAPLLGRFLRSLGKWLYKQIVAEATRRAPA